MGKPVRTLRWRAAERSHRHEAMSNFSYYRGMPRGSRGAARGGRASEQTFTVEHALKRSEGSVVLIDLTLVSLWKWHVEANCIGKSLILRWMVKLLQSHIIYG